jgi:hypothetical protein
MLGAAAEEQEAEVEEERLKTRGEKEVGSRGGRDERLVGH